jgi:hypothetical protein
MLTVPDMMANAAHDAPPPPPVPLRCHGCAHLATREHPAGTLGPHGTSARCKAAEGGTRVIGWEWQPQDAAPPWCPKRSAPR